MTIDKLAAALALETVVSGDADTPVTGGYCGDLLSWVMGRAHSGDAWITVMGNVNAIAVAVLADATCIILAENSPLDDDARVRAQSQGVTVLRSPKPAYTLAVELHQALAAE